MNCSKMYCCFDIMSIVFVETWFLVLMALFGSLACLYKNDKINAQNST